MAQKDTKKAPAKKSPAKKQNKSTAKKRTGADEGARQTRVIHYIMPFVFITLALFVALCFLSPTLGGVFGGYVRDSIFGVFGTVGVLIPILVFLLGAFWRRMVFGKKIYARLIYAACGVVCGGAFFQAAFYGVRSQLSAAELFENGGLLRGGGVVGGAVSQLLCKYIGIFAPVLMLTFCLIFLLLTFGITPYSVYAFIKKRREAASSRILEDMDGEEEYGDEKEPDDVIIKKPKPEKSPHVGEAEDDSVISNDDRIDLEDNDGRRIRVKPVGAARGAGGLKKKKRSEYDIELDGEARLAEPEKSADKPVIKISDPPPGAGEAAFDIDEILNEFVGEDEADTGREELEVVSKPVGFRPEEIKPLEDKKPPYRFPPVSLLKLDNELQSSDSSEELLANSQKLIDMLNSFNIKATVSHISRGPTITRYELKLAPGIRVASVSRLVDDISMSFATMGVRIEAPIPGKEAVGIEVPNSKVSIVRLRELIDTEIFKKAESKLICALGIDVVGDPVFLDIHKMPHLLIAGATGMGKSVCINSLITSILYKATAEEVKLILIDPKKVEFLPYSGIPHLLVPVVSNPKKAAGTLHWAVGEMERRYDLIESVGVRDIFGYNKATQSDCEKEHLPQVVIIIDELADLMMTAPADVEESICRLAQKARAAGMHLIIGTQRPSVDVITGLIKANIPSRIACKTASQVDSRTILDIAGAEKLIGRGDMLYAPVGISKPRRLQGAFVGDGEIEAVVSFIKRNTGEVAYNSDVIQKIELEAQLVSSGKRAVSHDADSTSGEEGDEMLRPAIEFAFECGKVSTSLFQRKLSIGYGRAAKIIDRMQEMGICSAADGNKPRTLLMTRQQYLDMLDGN